jgi:hypothetical protein
MRVISHPSSLLFAIEKPNIYIDDLLPTEVSSSPAPFSPINDELLQRLGEVLDMEDGGPLGLLGHELVCKWAYRLRRTGGLREYLEKCYIRRDEIEQ